MGSQYVTENEKPADSFHRLSIAVTADSWANFITICSELRKKKPTKLISVYITDHTKKQFLLIYNIKTLSDKKDIPSFLNAVSHDEYA